MRIRDLSEAGYSDAFEKGAANPVLSWNPSTPASRNKKSPAASPFDSLSSSDAKRILGAILNGKPLDTNQKFKLQQIYKQL
jgi:hypothetical protein